MIDTMRLPRFSRQPFDILVEIGCKVCYTDENTGQGGEKCKYCIGWKSSGCRY